MEAKRIYSGTYKFYLRLESPFGVDNVWSSDVEVWVDKNNFIHRENEYAYICYTGDKVWFQHGRKHRTNGPAVEYINGKGEWFINGKLLSIDKVKLLKLWHERNNSNGS
jgi:hypothetical protein